MREESTKSLIEKCIARDETAWSHFVYRYSGLLTWAIWNRLRRRKIHCNEEDAKDIKQLLLAEIWEKNRLAELRDVHKIVPWLAIVAGNFSYNYMRNKNRYPGLADAAASCHGSDVEVIADPHTSGAALENKELTALIEHFIGSLPLNQQTVVTLHYYYEKNHRQIAEITKLPINSVWTIIRRTRLKLQAELRDKGYLR